MKIPLLSHSSLAYNVTPVYLSGLITSVSWAIWTQLWERGREGSAVLSSFGLSVAPGTDRCEEYCYRRVKPRARPQRADFLERTEFQVQGWGLRCSSAVQTWVWLRVRTRQGWGGDQNYQTKWWKKTFFGAQISSDKTSLKTKLQDWCDSKRFYQRQVFWMRYNNHIPLSKIKFYQVI